MHCNKDNCKNIKVIAIDGPAGAGKSTVAKRLADLLGFSYLDTGAMYRAITLKALRLGVNLENEEDLAKLANNTKIDLEGGGQSSKVFLDREDVTQEIRTLEVTNNTFYIARVPKVREVMVSLQKDIGNTKSVVVEGRDVTTVVFPNAFKKFYLDGNVDERAKRRFKEWQAKQNQVDPVKLLEEVKDRDNKDLTREVGALKKAEDAIVIDSTDLSIEEVVNKMLGYINQ
ncbi:MAG: (d)CMP kinase [Candidatus Zapsychrus exili]|nr:(d)CMP kinase [Candidatus Zapsychrus exili]